MSSGKTHDKVNSIVAISILGLGIATQTYELTLLSLGLAVGTIWLSPDIDIPNSLPSQRFGVLKSLLVPYQELSGHHRSWISHTPVISTLIRLIYFCSPLVGYLLFKGEHELIHKVTLSREFLYLLAGLEISTDIHLLLDWQYSTVKQIRKRFNT